MAAVQHLQARDGDGKAIPGMFAPHSTVAVEIKDAKSVDLIKGANQDQIVRFVSNTDIVLTVVHKGETAGVPIFAKAVETYLIRRGSTVSVRGLDKDSAGDAWATVLR